MVEFCPLEEWGPGGSTIPYRQDPCGVLRAGVAVGRGLEELEASWKAGVLILGKRYWPTSPRRAGLEVEGDSRATIWGLCWELAPAGRWLPNLRYYEEVPGWSVNYDHDLHPTPQGALRAYVAQHKRVANAKLARLLDEMAAMRLGDEDD